MKERERENTTLVGRLFKMILLTCDAAQKPEGGRIARVVVDHPLGRGLRQGQRERDGLVELSPSRFDSDDW